MRPEWDELERHNRLNDQRPKRLFAGVVVGAFAVLAWTHFVGSMPEATPSSAVVEADVREVPAPDSSALGSAIQVERSSPSREQGRRESHVGVYECVVSGQRVVSDRPCGAGAQARTLVVDKPDPREVARLQQQWNGRQQAYSTPARSGGTAALPTTTGDNYCIYVRSRVTREYKIHTCRSFKSFQECQIAAERIDGDCGRPR
jgi:hypothetical protein